MKLAIITTHPIQYYAPVFQLLSRRGNIQVKVFYTWEPEAATYDKGFGKNFQWDIPLLEGYDHQFVSNNGSRRKDFRGVRNPSLVREIMQWGADAVLVFGWNYYSHLNAMRYFKGKRPVLFRGDSTLLDEQGKFRKTIRKLFLRWIYTNVDYAFYVGSNNKAYFLEHGLRDPQLVFAPHAIDNERFGTAGMATDILPTGKALPTEAVKILFVGKFQPKKNPALLVDGVNALNSPDIHLLMIGNGELENELKERAKDNQRIHFFPFQNQSMMPSVYRMADVFCLPSQGPGETWGLAVNEAMASGRAVLVSDKVGCAEDLVRNGENGYTFRSGDLQDLINKIELLSNKKELALMGDRSREMITSWSFGQIVQAIESLCKTF